MMLWIGLLMATALAGGDGEEISRSRGRKDGVVVLWPRTVPATDDAAMAQLAGALQQQLAAAAAPVVSSPNRLDVRPAPERVCSQVGCKAASVSLMLGHRNGGCAVVGMVSGPGIAQQQLIPLVGEMQLAATSIPFRQAPEQQLTITEFVPCASVGTLDLSGVTAALQRLIPVP